MTEHPSQYPLRLWSGEAKGEELCGDLSYTSYDIVRSALMPCRVLDWRMDGLLGYVDPRVDVYEYSRTVLIRN